MGRITLTVVWLCLAVVAGTSGVAVAESATAHTLLIKDHRFEPAELRGPAGKPLTLIVQNRDSTPEEFEIRALKVEKIVGGGKDITVRLAPLKPGRYEFVGEFNEASAKGTLVIE